MRSHFIGTPAGRRAVSGLPGGACQWARQSTSPSSDGRIYHELFGELAAPIQRVGAPFTPVPASRPLEAGFMVGPAQIEAAIRQTLS
jgi:pyruvate/2-oxoglutarate/acetoin dehydrogenase E1 component